MGLEINLLSIIPLIKRRKNLFPSEASIKYFITQTIASAIIMLAIIINLNIEEFIPQNSSIFTNIIINSGLLTKLGAAPFHYWFPEVIEGLNWNICLIILTWQKIAPMVILIYNLNLTLFFSAIIIISSLIRGILGLNQIRIRKILTYSSINHIRWIIARIFYSISIWFIYFIVYSIISVNIIMILKNFNIFYIKQLFNALNNNKTIKILFILNFLSLGGIPPFLGFLPKWLTINYIVENNFYFLRAILIVFTLISLYFYIRIIFNTISLYSYETIQISHIKPRFILLFTNFIALASLTFCTFILNF